MNLSLSRKMAATGTEMFSGGGGAAAAAVGERARTLSSLVLRSIAVNRRAFKSSSPTGWDGLSWEEMFTVSYRECEITSLMSASSFAYVCARVLSCVVQDTFFVVEDMLTTQSWPTQVHITAATRL